ncbi:MAG: hypothetical protein LUG99_22350 [Lachnospiraceae bacterium]|nr:hypothetical protein [Lachnospiraceae bacterium]
MKKENFCKAYRGLLLLGALVLGLALACLRPARVMASETTEDAAQSTEASDSSATTETETSGTTATKKKSGKVSKWYTAKSGNVYYYDENGKKLKGGKYKINGKYYYFDSKGIQRTGWQKIGSSYYYFRIAKRKNGYMVTSKTINGITIKKNGKAKMNSYSKRKLPILYKANVLMRSLTKNSDTKSQKLRKVYEYTRSYYRYASLGSFVGGNNWDMYYAEKVLVSGSIKADCYTFASVFAYLANAVGYKVNVVSSGWHGWAEIGNKFYDPSWSRSDTSKDYCGITYGTQGNFLLNYQNSRKYVIAI